MRWRGGLALAALLAVGAAPAAAQSAAPLDVRIERDTTPRVEFSELGADFRVTLTDRATAQPPAEKFTVFGLIRDQAGKESQAFPCGHAKDNDPSVRAGLYECKVYADRGGRYDFVAVVNEPTDGNQAPRTLARATLPFDLVTDQVYTGDPGRTVIRGRFLEVFMLWGHGLSAAGWFVAALALAALALPKLRRQLSDLAVYRLERRLDLIVRGTVVLTGLVIGTGIYLLLNQTAYETPFSTSSIDGVFALPFGEPYFVALAAKLAIYALMVPALLPLMRGAQRNLRLRAAASPASPAPNPWQATAATGSVATAVKPQTTQTATAERPATGFARVCGLVVIIGVPAILFCVTLLKYFHELVEASRILQ